MHTVKEFNELGLELEESLYLRFVPIALKVLYSRDEVPEGCYIPSRDRNEHPALCQAFAQVRRNKRSMAMFREDHWCVDVYKRQGLKLDIHFISPRSSA